jgi:hypothetical protein
MTDDLLQLVESELLPALVPLGFQVTESDVADVFDNASVVLAAPPLRIRVVRERSIVVLDVGPPSEPGMWFDSAVVMDYLGLSSTAGFHDHDARNVLRGAGTFITSMWHELTTKFGPRNFATTKRELNALGEERASRLFGE